MDTSPIDYNSGALRYPSSPGAPSLLIVSDVPEQLEVMSVLLKEAGYPVLTASNAQEGLTLAEQERPDLIICDVSMIEMDGIELCCRLRANPDLALTPILLVSTVRKGHESAIAALKAGADDYLESHYDPLLLTTKVERLLARYSNEKALKASQQQLQFIVDTVPVYIAMCDSEGRFTFVNRRYAERFGLRREDVIGRRIIEVLGAETYESLKEYVNDALKGQPVEFEIEIPYREVDTRWMHAAYVPEVDAGGAVRGFVAVLTDVTARKQVEEALKESQESLARAQQVAHTGSWDWDLLTNKVHWSDEMFRIYGITKEEFGENYESAMNFTHPDDWERIKRALEALLSSHKPFDMDYRIVLPDGTVRATQGRTEVYCDKDGRPVRMIGTVQDITERKHAEEQIKNSNEQLRALSARLESAREEEGIRIARELHDELGGAMTGLKWDLESISKSLSGINIEGDTKKHIQSKFETMNGLIDSSIETVRRISSELRPRLLDDLGLTPAIEHYVEEFQKRTDIKCDLQLQVDNMFLPKEYSTTIFRILQESLTNIARHSEAKRVNILLLERDGQIILEVEDYGRGFSQDSLSLKKSVGIVGMRERARQLGGELDIISQPGKGTKVAVALPAPNNS